MVQDLSRGETDELGGGPEGRPPEDLLMLEANAPE